MLKMIVNVHNFNNCYLPSLNWSSSFRVAKNGLVLENSDLNV